MYKSDTFDRKQGDSDPDKKLFLQNRQRAQFEKRIFWLLVVLMVLAWVFVLQDILLELGLSKGGWQLETQET